MLEIYNLQSHFLRSRGRAVISLGKPLRNEHNYDYRTLVVAGFHDWRCENSPALRPVDWGLIAKLRLIPWRVRSGLQAQDTGPCRETFRSVRPAIDLWEASKARGAF